MTKNKGFLLVAASRLQLTSAIKVYPKLDAYVF